MLDIQSQIDLWHIEARNACAGLSDQLTVGSAPILDTAENTTWLDIAIVIDSERGNRRAGATGTLQLEVTAFVHAANPELCFRRSEALLQAALGRIDANDELAALHGDGATYDRGQLEGGRGGSFNAMVRVIRSKDAIRIDSRPGPALGINIDSTGEIEHGAATSVQTAKSVEPETLSAIQAPATLVFIYANAEIGDDVELLDSGGNVVQTEPVVDPGSNKTTFWNVTTPGEYRARIAGNLSNLTALVISAP